MSDFTASLGEVLTSEWQSTNAIDAQIPQGNLKYYVHIMKTRKHLYKLKRSGDVEA